MRGGKENEGLHLKRRKEDQAVQILPGPGPLCVCVGLGPAPHYSCWDTAFKTIYSVRRRCSCEPEILFSFFLPPLLSQLPRLSFPLSAKLCHVRHCLLKLQPWFIVFTQWRRIIQAFSFAILSQLWVKMLGASSYLSIFFFFSLNSMLQRATLTTCFFFFSNSH